MKKILSVFLAVLLFSLLPVSALAEDFDPEDLPPVVDETGILLSQTLEDYNNDILPSFGESYGLDMRVNIVRTIPEDMDCRETAEFFYDVLRYGWGDKKNGLLLLMYVSSDGDSAELLDYTVYAGGDSRYVLESLEEFLNERIAVALEDDYGNPSLTLDASRLEEILGLFAEITDSVMSNFTADGHVLGEYSPPSGEPMAGGEYVRDYMGLLTPEEVMQLDELAGTLSERYGVGVYLVIVENSEEFNGRSDAYDAAVSYFDSERLGLGESADGVLLFMSMENRQMGLDVHGYFGNRCINERQNEDIRGELGDYFGDDRWYDGFVEYLNQAEDHISFQYEWELANPDMVDPYTGVSAYVPPSFRVLAVVILVIIALIIAGLVVFALRRQLRSVYTGSEAHNYVVGDGLVLDEQYDRFTHTSTSRTYSPQEKSSSSGGGGGSSGGHSGGSSSF